MKKYSIFMIAPLAAGALTSCEDAPAVAPIQENPQGPVITTSEFTIAPENVLSSTINLDNMVDATALAVFTVTNSELPEGYDMNAVMEIATDDKFEEVYNAPLTEVDGVYNVNPGDLQDAHTELIGDSELGESTMYYRVAGFLQSKADKNLTYRFGGTDYYLASGSFKEIPMVSIMETDYLYTPGGSNGWNQLASQYLYPKKNDGVVDYYYGSILVNGEFKICQTPNWDVNWGGSNGILTPNGDNLKGEDGNGLYWVTADIAKLTYSVTKINSVSVIGGGDWNTDRNLTPNEDQTIWTGDVTIDGEWKIRMNGNWDYNYGGKLKSPVLNGENFKGTDGEVTVTVNFAGHHPVITVKAK